MKRTPIESEPSGLNIPFCMNQAIFDCFDESRFAGGLEFLVRFLHCFDAIVRLPLLSQKLFVRSASIPKTGYSRTRIRVQLISCFPTKHQCWSSPKRWIRVRIRCCRFPSNETAFCPHRAVNGRRLVGRERRADAAVGRSKVTIIIASRATLTPSSTCQPGKVVPHKSDAATQATKWGPAKSWLPR